MSVSLRIVAITNLKTFNFFLDHLWEQSAVY